MLIPFNKSMISLVLLSLGVFTLIGFLSYGSYKLIKLGVEYRNSKKAIETETRIQKENMLRWYEENKDELEALRKEYHNKQTTHERKKELKKDLIKLLEKWHATKESSDEIP